MLPSEIERGSVLFGGLDRKRAGDSPMAWLDKRAEDACDPGAAPTRAATICSCFDQLLSDRQAVPGI